MREYYRVMGASGRMDATDREVATVAEVCEMFLEAKSQMRDSTCEKYRFYLGKFAAPFSGRQFRTLRKEDVLRAAGLNPKWGPGTRYAFVKSCVSVFRWARDAGYLEWNPLAGWENPYPVPSRPRGLTEAEYEALVSQSHDVQWKQVMSFMRGTGCRPGEVGVVEARHVHPERPLVTLEKDLHKTGRRTGRAKVLVLPADVELMVRALCVRYPKGPIFRNAWNGGAWNRFAIEARFRRYRKKLGLSPSLVPHMIRHATLSRMLNGGTDVHLVAKIAGHADTTTLLNTYFHPDVDLMVAAADKAHKIKKG